VRNPTSSPCPSTAPNILVDAVAANAGLLAAASQSPSANAPLRGRRRGGR
jgi:hypothetical protein